MRYLIYFTLVVFFLFSAALCLCQKSKISNSHFQEIDTSILKALFQANEESKAEIQNLSKQVADLKSQLQKQQRIGYDKFTSTSLFLDAAISSVNSL